jgi:predicted  nucleic acid-binding Zn-ribbon protein
MKNQELKKSLVKSGILSVLLVFFIYAFAVSDSGGIIGTISSLFTAAVFLIGLALAIALCVAVMFGIYFGILYMYDYLHDLNSCKSTYNEFKVQLHDSTKTLSCCPVITKCLSKQATAATVSEEDLHPLRSNQDELKNQLDELQTSVAGLAKNLSSFSSSITGTTEEIAQLDEKMSTIAGELENKATAESVEEATKKLSADITAIQGAVKPLSNKLTELETALSSLETEEEGGDGTQEEVNSAISGIQAELANMKSSIERISSSQPRPESNEDDDNHRILSRFTNKNDEKKFTTLVTEAVSKGMTYAQIDEFLNDSLSKEASEVIASHPSLTKDYIKIARQKA